MTSNKTISNKLIKKLSVSFLVIILIIGVVYICTTYYLIKQFYSETSQHLNANVANHLVEEKFRNASPYLENGKVNKELFDDLMHDMMAVNRAIEVYLLNDEGGIVYSVVLDHSDPKSPMTMIDLNPINKFISNNQAYVLGDDPRDKNNKKIFSAAYFEKENHSGYIYIILASEKYQEVCNSLFSSFFLNLGLTTSLITMFSALLLGLLSIWFLTKSLRSIIYHVNKFKEGNLKSRIPNPEKSDLSILAVTFNQMAETIAANIKEINAVNQFRKDLIANVSHDLRLPLTSIKGYVETLRLKGRVMAIDDKTEFMNIIEKSAEYLGNMINQLFDYSKLDAKNIKICKEPVDIITLLLEIKKRYIILAKTKNIILEINGAKEAPLVLADSTLIERVIQNIIDNAIKFTPEKGKVVVTVLVKKTLVTIQIKDSGFGMSELNKQLVYNNENQQREIDYYEQGMGLGLAIVKKMIELHNSKLKIKSKPNEGTLFEFSLPIYEENCLLYNQQINISIR